MSQLDAELEHAGEETTLSPQMLLLEQLRITPEKQLPRMDFLFRLFGKPCFPRRELVAITGKAKSGKTFVTSMLMACCQSRDVFGHPVTVSSLLEQRAALAACYQSKNAKFFSPQAVRHIVEYLGEP